MGKSALNMQSTNRASKHGNPPRKKAQKKKGDNVSAFSCSVAFGAEELLLVTQAFMKVSTNVKQSTDWKAETFWDEVYVTFAEFVATAIKLNESNPDFSPIEYGRETEPIRNAGSNLYNLLSRNL